MIFVVEDDHGVRELELYALRQSGYQAEGFETPRRVPSGAGKDRAGLRAAGRDAAG